MIVVLGLRMTKLKRNRIHMESERKIKKLNQKKKGKYRRRKKCVCVGGRVPNMKETDRETERKKGRESERRREEGHLHI